MSVASVSPGNGGRKPFRSAVWRVEMAGENSAAWANATKLAGVSEWQLRAGAAKLCRLLLSVGVGPWMCSASGGLVLVMLAAVFGICSGRIQRPW